MGLRLTNRFLWKLNVGRRWWSALRTVSSTEDDDDSGQNSYQTLKGFCVALMLDESSRGLMASSVRRGR